ncbi:MAG TPA: malectin domain-containing carbohydrate-binding protein, partial [Planctomycetota bacterium]|nr:malectin domain-containing carbohydrate-binding protein [Planctomycetota bacterium]
QWELSANLSAFTLLGHEGSSTKHPHDVALFSEGRLAATAGDEGVRLWDLARRMELCHLVDRKVRGVYFGSNPRSIITFGSSGLRRWPIHAMDDHSLRLLVGPVEQLNEAEAVYSAAADRAGITVAGVQDGGTVCWQDLESGRSLLFPGQGNPTAIEVSPDGRLLAMACAEGNEVTIWPTETLASLAKLGGSNDGGAAGASSAAPQPLHRIPAARASIKFHPGGTHILTCTPQEYAYWRLGKAEALWRIPRQISLQYSVRGAFSDDGRTVALAYNDSKIWLVETSSGDKLAELEAPEHIQISGLAMAGGRLAASTVGRRFHVWDLNCMAGELTQLGLRWRVPTQGAALEGAAPLHAFVAGNSLRTLRGESAELFERQLFRPRQRVPYLPELLSCADLDEAIEDFRYLVAEHDAWRYLRGFSEPSPGLEWTDRAFDDKTWLRGQSPLTGWNTPAAIEGTLLSDQVGGYTSLYLRASFEVADPSAVSRLILSIELEDGCVAFLNGTEVGRSNAGKAGEPFTCHSLAGQFYRRRCVEVFELSPKQLVAGVNQLALQARTYDPTSKVYATPVLAAVMAPSADGDRKRTLNVAAGSDGAPEASLAAYRQGRILQRSSQWAQASLEFERAGRLDRVSVEPTLRRAACYRALGEPRRAESVLREAIEGGSAVDRIRLWRAWFATIALDLKLSPSEALAEFPHERRSDSSVESADSCDIRWLLSELAAGRPLRLRCGGPELKINAGTVWSGDAFFLGGASSPKANAGQATSAQADGDRALYAVFRSFSGRLGGFLPAYSIPLPPGRYSVTLHFAETQHHEPRKRNFDIFLEEHAVFDGYDPYAAGAGRPDAQTFDVEVVDGALDLAFRRHIDTARICAIEVAPRPQ